MLTAAHCVGDLPPPYDNDAVWFTLGDDIQDPDDPWRVDDDVVKLTGDREPHPDFASHHNYAYDVGVFVLDVPVTGVSPAAPAPVGTLDDHALRHERFTATGNGGTCYGDSGGPHSRGDTSTVVAITTTGDIPCNATTRRTTGSTPRSSRSS